MRAMAEGASHRGNLDPVSRRDDDFRVLRWDGSIDPSRPELEWLGRNRVELVGRSDSRVGLSSRIYGGSDIASILTQGQRLLETGEFDHDYVVFWPPGMGFVSASVLFLTGREISPPLKESKVKNGPDEPPSNGDIVLLSAIDLLKSIQALGLLPSKSSAFEGGDEENRKNAIQKHRS